MVVGIHQPNYIPYMGLFYKVFKSDVFVFLDDVQYSNDSGTNYNLVKTPQGSVRLKVPVEQHLGYKINEVRPKDELGWKEKHLRTIEMNYKKAPHYREVYDELEDIFKTPSTTMDVLNENIIQRFLKKFGIERKIVRSATMGLTSKKQDLVIDIVSLVGGDVYFSGKGASVYQNEKDFSDNGIELIYTDYKPVEYKQLWEGFIPNLSVVDYVMNCGFAIPDKWQK